MFEHAGHKKKILPSFLCAGYANGQKDSCEVSKILVFMTFYIFFINVNCVTNLFFFFYSLLSTGVTFGIMVKSNSLTKKNVSYFSTVIQAVRLLCHDLMDVINSLELCRMVSSVQHRSFLVST